MDANDAITALLSRFQNGAGAIEWVDCPCGNRYAKAGACGDCAERQGEQAKREEAWALICPPLYRDTDPARLNPKLLAKVAAWTGDDGRGLLMAGKTGAGKTRTAFLALRQRYDSGKTVCAVSGPKFDIACARQFSDDQSAKDAKRLLANCTTAGVLLFDELAKGKFTERVETELFALIEHRTSHLLPTIWTTNSSDKELAERLSEDRGGPILRRIKEFSDLITA